MTEEIIIDGVDVAGCGYFYETDKECNICGMGTDGEDTFCRDCKDNSNCYYKQLKRLEQENRELRKANEISIEKVTVTAEAKRLQELEQENKELKTCIEMIENTEGQAHIEGVRLAKENKNYRSALEEIRVIADDTLKVCDDDCGNARKIKLIIDKINEVLNEKEL